MDLEKFVWFVGFLLKIMKIANLANLGRANGGVRVLETPWKHHKSRDHNFLHRSYTPQKKSAPKKYFCSDSKKSFSEIFENHRQKFSKSQNVGFWKSRFWSQKNVDFFRRFLIIKKNIFFRSVDPIFFSKLEKNLGYSFDVKNYILSIYDVFRAIRCPQMRFLAL